MFTRPVFQFFFTLTSKKRMWLGGYVVSVCRQFVVNLLVVKFNVRDLVKHERLTHSLAIYNGSILLRLLYVLLSCQQHRLRKLPYYNIRVEYYNRLRQTWAIWSVHATWLYLALTQTNSAVIFPHTILYSPVDYGLGQENILFQKCIFWDKLDLSSV
jgi:hypothetical protein